MVEYKGALTCISGVENIWQYVLGRSLSSSKVFENWVNRLSS